MRRFTLVLALFLVLVAGTPTAAGNRTDIGDVPEIVRSWGLFDAGGLFHRLDGASLRAWQAAHRPVRPIIGGLLVPVPAPEDRYASCWNEYGDWISGWHGGSYCPPYPPHPPAPVTDQ